MRRNFVRWTAVFAAAAMTVTMLAGCGNAKQQGQTANTNTQAVKAETTSAAADVEETESSGKAEKPEKIKIMVDGTFQATVANGQAEWKARWEELTGIKLEIIQPDHSAYYDVVGQMFAGNAEDWPDVVLLGSSYYPGYAEEGALWDMTETWNASGLKQNPRTRVDVVESNMIDGKLYGLSISSGGGCLTYYRKSWLDNCGLTVPTTYEEYLQVLDAFTNGDPDGDGVNGNTYGVSAAGIIAPEAPWVMYLPEFYQEAFPTFYQKEDGSWVDGFTEDSMKEALLRLQDAYGKGYIDKEALTNATSNCRTKFMEGQYGAFTYWAGGFATTLSLGLEANGLDGELIAAPPIAEVGQYWERTSPVYAITSACKNPEGVFEYFLEPIFDNGDMQILWTYGVEDVHWSTKAETVCGNTYEEGEFHTLENKEQAGVQWTSVNMGPLGCICPMENNPGLDFMDERNRESLKVFNANAKSASLPVTNEVINQYNGDLTSLKNNIIAECVVNGLSVEEGYQRFEREGGAKWSQEIVDSLNAK